MEDPLRNLQLTVLWDQFEEPKADEVLRQVAKWILDDPNPHSPDATVDNCTRRTLNEGVPVENTN
jgi:hypothetical protein